MSAHTWGQEDPRLDRAIGALLGAAAAPAVAGDTPTTAPDLVDPHADTTHGAARLGRLITTTLANIDTPEALTKAVGADTEGAWTQALRHTILEGTPPRIEVVIPSDVAGLAWRAVAKTPPPDLDPAARTFPCDQLVGAVQVAHATGGTEAAMYAGALGGAWWGASAVPLRAQRRLAETLPPREVVTAAIHALRGADPRSWPQRPHLLTHPLHDPAFAPFAVAHPHDTEVVLCTLEHARTREDADAMVSLCRTGPEDAPASMAEHDRVQVWLADTPGANPNLAFVLDEAARAVAQLRAEGKRVLLHCAACQSRTPAVAAHYAALAHNIDISDALRAGIHAVGGHLDNPELARTAAALHGVKLDDPHTELFPNGLAAPTR